MRVSILSFAFVVAIFWALGSSAIQAATFKFEISRLTADQLFPGGGFSPPEDELPTFSGLGRISFASPADDPSRVMALSLRVETLGTDASNASGFGADTVHRFLYGETDITSVALAVAGSSLTGTLDFGGLAGKSSTNGEVVLQNLFLNFNTGRASGFCFSGSGAPGTAECVRGGGTSTGIEAQLDATVVPLPPAFALLLMPIAGLAMLSRRGRRRDTAEA